MAENVEYPSLDLLYTETRDRLIRQNGTIEHVNTKTSIIIGVDMVLIVAFLGVLTNMGSMIEQVTPSWHPWLIATPALVSGALVIASLVFAAIAFRPVTYKEVLDPRGAHDELICLEVGISKMQLLHSMIDSFEKTKEAIDKNLRWFRASLWTVVLAAILVAAIATGLFIYGIGWG